MSRSPASDQPGGAAWAAGSFLLAAFYCIPAGPAAAQEYPWQVETSVTMDTGDYGTDETTDLFYWPVTLKRYFSRGDLALTVPYIDLQTEGGQVVVDGQVAPGDGSGGSGLGDVLLKGRYSLMEQTAALPFVDLVFRIKFSTADERRGLGTGEADFSLGVEFARRFQTDNIWFADYTHTFMGDPPDTDYDNRTAIQLGLGRDLLPALMGCVLYDFRSAIRSGSDDAHTVSLLANARISPQFRAYAMVDFGLSDGAADRGATVGASYRFR